MRTQGHSQGFGVWPAVHRHLMPCWGSSTMSPLPKPSPGTVPQSWPGIAHSTTAAAWAVISRFRPWGRAGSGAATCSEPTGERKMASVKHTCSLPRLRWQLAPLAPAALSGTGFPAKASPPSMGNTQV